MTTHYYPNGWIPRFQNESDGRRNLLRWIRTTAGSGEFGAQRRSVFRDNGEECSWEFEQVHVPTPGVAVPLDQRPREDRLPKIRTVRHRLFNFDAIPFGDRDGSTKGWVAERRGQEFVLRDAEYILALPGRLQAQVLALLGPGGPQTNEHLRDYTNYGVIRCLPANDTEMQAWGYHHDNDRQWLVIKRECQTYNSQVRTRLVRDHLMPGRAHRQTVNARRDYCQQWIALAAIQLATCVESGAYMNFAPQISDTLGANVRLGARRPGDWQD